MTKDNLAIRIHDISKIYRLWNSPKEKLTYSLLRWITAFLPFQWLKNNKKQNENIIFLNITGL